MKYAELIECDGYSADGEWYSAGWGYRDTATGELFTGEGDGDHWSDETAEQNAIAAGYVVANSINDKMVALLRLVLKSTTPIPDIDSNYIPRGVIRQIQKLLNAFDSVTSR